MRGSKSRWIGLSMLLLISSFSLSASCSKPPVETVEVVATVNCKEHCIAVSRAFIEEHAAWGAALVKLQASLKACQAHPER